MEKFYFHAKVGKYKRNLRRAVIIVTIPVFMMCVFCSIVIVLNFIPDLIPMMLLIIAFGVLVAMVFTFAAVYIADKLARRHTRFTYFDIVPDGMVYSEYAGEFKQYGKRIILRRLYYIPFKSLESIARDEKQSPHDITFHGEIREYLEDSNRLGYHISEDGTLYFDTVPLNTRYYKTLSKLTIRNRFGNTRRIEKSARAYWEEFKQLPPKQPFDITKVISIRKRRKLKTSNPLLEAPSFSRNWK